MRKLQKTKMSCFFTVFAVFQGGGAKGGADKQTTLCPKLPQFYCPE